MAIENNLTVSNFRLIPRDTDFLDRKVGSKGEVYYDRETNTIRLFDGTNTGGIALLRADLENIEGQISSVIPSATPPTDVDPGTIWFDTNTGKSYVYYDDGNSRQWIQPSTPSVGGGGGGGGGGANNLNELSDVTISSPSVGQVLKYNGSSWINDADALGTGGGSLDLEDLTNVIVTTPITGEFLRYNGSEWANGTINAFTKITVTGQNDIDAENTNDALNLVAGSGITITTNDTTDTLTISATISAGATEFPELTDAITANLTIDRFYLPAITRLRVTNSGAVAYLFDQYTGNNPTIYSIGGTTIAFELAASGHPFVIQDGTGTNYNIGLVHVAANGTVSQGTDAQGKDSGTLYWKVPASISGNYRYQCSVHGAMVGNIVVKNITAI